jgi:hypothetical protein
MLRGAGIMSTQAQENKPIEFRNVYYIKLGRGGIWEKSSIENEKLRIGWAEVDLDDVNRGNWEKVEMTVKGAYATKGAGTRDFNALRTIVDSTPEDIWITFDTERMWWCRVGKPGVFEDKTSKYRELESPWCDRAINGKELKITDIPGQISKTRGFRATVCRIEEKEVMSRLLNGQSSHAFEAISLAKRELERAVIDGIRHLHWRDFEILIDLIFRGAGWRRITGLGGHQKYTDMDLIEPITGDMYRVQVKSSASLNDFLEYARGFTPGPFRKFFFVVHTPSDDLAHHVQVSGSGVELILPERLAGMVVDFGLINWVLKKVEYTSL